MQKKKYINEYLKEHYSQFSVRLSKETISELNELLKKNNLTKVKFLLLAIEQLKRSTK